MEYIVENENYPVFDVLKNINIFKLIFTINEEILSDFNKELLNDNEINVNFNLKELKKLNLKNFYLDLDIKREKGEDNVKFIIENSDDEIENIQFKKFVFDVIFVNEDKYKMLINYEINDELYDKKNVKIFSKIIKKIFKNLQVYLNKLE